MNSHELEAVLNILWRNKVIDHHLRDWIMGLAVSDLDDRETLREEYRKLLEEEEEEKKNENKR